MRLRHFGDSYDVVKQALLKWLAPLGPWAVHPMFTEPVSDEDASAFAAFLGAPLLSSAELTATSERSTYLAGARTCQSHLFLDPDTGLRLATVRGKDAPRYLFGDELRDIVLARPGYLTLVFDQSLSRAGQHDGLVEKLAALRSLGLAVLAYQSHACFLLASAHENAIHEACRTLGRESHLPERRILVVPRERTEIGETARKVIARLVSDEEVVFRFFAVFSRFEYALKRTAFLKPGEAKADWKKYEDTLRGRFSTVATPAFKEACTFLEQEPPRKQVVDGTSLDWKDSHQGDGEFRERYLLRLVRTVRNNLFHGGKYPSGPISDAARNQRLIESCVVVLEECLNLSPAVAGVFEDVA